MGKRISAIIMTLFLALVSYNIRQAEDPKTVFLTSIANLEKEFYQFIISFVEMVADAFGVLR
ncbi:hypothetical protein AB1O99_06940 (plasmid) [Borrelia hermsii]|uniref:Variable large protein n=1 Tax=Borrelia hermsii TaxID=140 RepID=A0AAN0X7E6_BORHE|nr:hypothetical protein [Borrelia hermsii]AMR76131.1 hypothetical protein A0V01_05955 [Borrelia hermsii]UPA08637.1 hypothetical protein bhDAH_001362 [Borrelia hermsii DAH]